MQGPVAPDRWRASLRVRAGMASWCRAERKRAVIRARNASRRLDFDIYRGSDARRDEDIYLCAVDSRAALAPSVRAAVLRAGPHTTMWWQT